MSSIVSKKKVFVKAEVMLRLATAADLKNERGTARKMGQPFWIRSQKTGAFDNCPLIIDRDTNLHELKAWLDQRMLYVPATYFELEDGK